jgi:ferrochelatase
MYHHKTGVLLLQLGTPDSPSTSDVRKYLSEFLNDPRVIDVNPILRAILVNLIIVPFRAPKSAKLYKEIWTEEGSPLMIYGNSVKNKLSLELGNDYVVELGMRYRKPAIETAIKNMIEAKVGKIIVLPLFPQFASSSTGSAVEKAMNIIQKLEVMPDVDIVSTYYSNEGYINCWNKVASKFNYNDYDQVMFTFHGVPWRHIRKSGCNCNCKEGPKECDIINENNFMCYRAQCFATARSIAKSLGIPESSYKITFQSRLGSDPWLTPYTDETLVKWAKSGIKKVLVFSPSFVADCLETIHEVGTEYNELFQHNGGESVTLVPSLNDSDVWIEFLASMVHKSNKLEVELEK